MPDIEPGEPLTVALPMVTGADAQANIAADARGGTMRDRIVPMIAAALKRFPPYGLDITGWDFCIMPAPNGIVAGVVMAVKGVDLLGPGKELGQFVAFSTWHPQQGDVDAVVKILGQGLRDLREQQRSVLHRGL